MILVIGTGLLGEKVAEFFHSKGIDVVSTYNANKIKTDWRLVHLDITKKSEVKEVLDDGYDVVVLTSAYTDVDGCERNRDLAYKINAEGVRNIVDNLKNENLVYVSTDYVFDGEKGNYKEEDATNPINYYGKTKLIGEKIVKDYKDHLIARTSVIYGDNKLSFVLWVINALKSSKDIYLLEDSYASPTFNINFAEALYELIKNNEQGIYHVTGSERINRYDFGLKIAEVFNLNKDSIHPTTMDKLNLLAKRPRNSSLNVEKIENYIKMNNVYEGLNRMKMVFKKDIIL